jgi:hypothetical protein
VQSDKYGSRRSYQETNILISMSTAGQSLFNYFDTGSKIEISFSGITHKENCQTWVQDEPEVELICIVTSNLITIYSRYDDYSTDNNIFVSLGITNPTSASRTFTMIMYDYYFSSSRFSKVIEKTATYTTDTTWVSKSK